MARAVLAALLSAALLPCAAGAQELKQTPNSRVNVTQCYPHMHAPGTAHPWIDPYGYYHTVTNFPYDVGFIDIGYTNTAPVAAHEVEFGLVARNALIAIANDVGTFAPGAKIEHEFSLDPQVFPLGTQFPYCAILRVKYADGTEWRNPNPPPT
jgi:hypothetical protein